MTRPLPDRIAAHGINFDQPAYSLPIDKYSDGMNVHFRAGEARRVEGHAPYLPAGQLGPAYFIHYVDYGAASYWIYVSETKIGVTDGISHYDLTPAGWGPIVDKRKKFTLGDLNTVPYVNHPSLGPYWWNGNVTSKFAKLPGWPANWTCYAMRPHRNYLMAMGIDSGAGNLEMQVSWSASAPPGTIPQAWTPSPTNDAGDVAFAETAGPILDGITLRDQFFVFKRNYTGSMQYIGGQYIFGQRSVFPTTGVFATDAVKQIGNMVYMLTDELQFIMHDGNQIANLSLGVFGDRLRRSINMHYPQSVFVYIDPEINQVFLAYPGGEEQACSEAISVEVGSGDVGIRELPLIYSVARGLTAIKPARWDDDPKTWDSDKTAWDQNAEGYAPEHVMMGSTKMLDVGASDDFEDDVGVWNPVVALVERQGLDLGEFYLNKTLTGAWPEIREGGAEMTMQFYGQQKGGGELDITDVLPVDPASLSGRLDFFMDGFFVGYQVQSIGGGVWSFAGLKLAARRSGRVAA